MYPVAVRRLVFAGLLIPLLFSITPAFGQAPPARLKAATAELLKKDAESLPSSAGVMFVGGSAAAQWDLRHYFPQYRTVNRGLDGALISDLTLYAEQLIVPLKPSTIIFFGGDRDVAAGIKPVAIVAEFGKFATKIHQTLPKTQIVVLSVRPVAARAESLALVQTTNEKLKAFIEQDKQVRFVDLNDLLVNPDGKPAADLQTADLKNLTKDGYDLISQVVRIAIKGAEERYWRGYNPPKGQ